MTDEDYTDDLILLRNTPALAESLLYSLKQSAGVIDLFLNANKTEFMSFNQRAISTLYVANF